MRQIKMIALAAVLSFSLYSCSDNEPETTAKNFINLTNQGEFAEAKKLGTEQTASFLSMSENLLGDKKAEMKEKAKDLKIEILSSDIKEDKAKVTYKVIGANIDKEQHLDLVKVDGAWKVDINFGL